MQNKHISDTEMHLDNKIYIKDGKKIKDRFIINGLLRMPCCEAYDYLEQFGFQPATELDFVLDDNICIKLQQAISFLKNKLNIQMHRLLENSKNDYDNSYLNLYQNILDSLSSMLENEIDYIYN